MCADPPVELVDRVGRVVEDISVDWNATSVIGAPPSSEVAADGIDHRALTAFVRTGAPLVGPSQPGSFSLSYGIVLPAPLTVENCRQASLVYTKGGEPSSGQVSMFEMPVRCTPKRPVGALPFLNGWRVDNGNGVGYEFDVGPTHVQVYPANPSDISTFMTLSPISP